MTIPASVTSIGASAFQGGVCDEYWDDINEGSYQDCRKLDQVVFAGGSQLEKIEDHAFSNNNLTSLDLPDSVISIGGSAFAENTNLVAVDFGESLVTIESYAFDGCSSLTEITLPNTLERINYHAFANTSLTSLVIPDSVSYIEHGAFSFNWDSESNKQLESVVIGDSLEFIPAQLFENQSNLHTVVIGDSVTDIGDSAFKGAPISSLIMGANVTSIGEHAFNAVNGDVFILKPAQENFDIYDFSSMANLYACDSLDDEGKPQGCSYAPLPPPAVSIAKNLSIFTGTANPNWAAWDCCGGTTPGLVVDADRGDVYQFEVGEAPTVLGFNARAGVSSSPTSFDASALLLADGYLRFEMKVITPPTNADSFWLMKIESADAATFAELNLNASVEGVDPVVGEWQTYTFSLIDLNIAGLDVSAIDVVMVFPAWGTGEGAVFQIDNLEITSPLVASPSLNIFTDEANASWAAWDCCGGTTPVVVQDEDADHGASIEFTVVGDTVLGFNARPDFTDSPEQFDASALMADGVVQFDLKVMTPTADAATPWLMKIESDNAATFAEVNLTTSVEGAAPSSEWQTYTFPVADLVQAGLDASAIDVLLIFPAWGSGDGAVYRVDNVRIYDPTASGGAFNGHVLFKDGALDAWALWDCCGGSTPSVVADDLDHGAVARFEVGEAPTVLGYNSRAEFASEPSQIDASSLLTDGVLQFEMKVVNEPNNADAAWLIKIESDNGVSFIELNLNDSVEGADPVVGQWQTYTFNLSDLSTAGLDVSAIDVVMVFPAWGTGAGAVYLLDNVMIYDPNSLPIRKGITIFENGQTDWAMWDCCGGSTPTVEVDDNVHGTAAEFVVGAAPTVLGFNARAEISSTPTVYDASALLTDGYLRFDMKVVTPPNNADAAWLMKIESSGAATFAELNLNTSVEGADPVVGEWQTYTFNLSDLSTAGLDVSAIDVVMVFPAWGTGEGAVYRIDNMVISAP